MARIKEKRSEKLSGSIGPVVACTWKGIPYLRSRPSYVNDPKTKKQLAQRSRFSIALALLRPLTPLLRVGFREEAKGQSAFNAAMSYTMRHVLEETPESIGVVYRKVLVSQGTLTGATQTRVELGDGQAVFTWNRSSRRGHCTPHDHVLTVVVHKPSQQAVYETNDAFRSDGRAQLAYPKDWKQEDVAAYLGFWNEKEGIASNSECLWGGE